MKVFRIYIVILFIHLSHLPVSAQISKPFIINIDKSKYAAGNQNWSVAINQSGSLYFGNNQGLLEFDGSNWNMYQMPDQMVVRSVATTEDSIIYVGSFEEFGYWLKDETGILHYNSLSSSLDPSLFHNDEIWRIIPHQNKIYFQSFSTIFVYDGKSIHTITPGFTMVLLCKARDRLFIHGVDRGLFELEGDSLRLIPESRILSHDEIKVVVPFPENKFLIGAAENGLFLYDGQTLEPWISDANELIKQAEINNGLAMDQGIVIGTIVNGIFIFDYQGNMLAHLNYPDYLQNNTILSLCPDKKGNIWAGLDRGIDYVQLDCEMDFYMNPTEISGTVYTAAIEKKSLWVGTNQGLFRYGFISGHSLADPELMEGTQGQVWNLTWADGDLLCGHTNGTYRIRNENIELISGINGGYCIRKIKIDNQDFLIQSTYSVFAIYKRGQSGWEFSHEITGFAEPVSSFEIDHLGNIWAAHISRGLFRLRLNSQMDSVQTLAYYGKEKGLPADRNLSVTNVENRIIFATGHSFFTYDDLNDTIVPYDLLNEQTGIFRQSRNITSIGENNYWLIRDNVAGLFKIENKSAKMIFSWDFARYGAYLVSGGTVVVPLDENSHLFCLDNGFAILNKEMIRQEVSDAEVSLRKIEATHRKGKSVYLPLEPDKFPVEISYPYRNLRFFYSSADFSMFPLYSHTMEGIEISWSDWSGVSFVEFSRLPAGEYIFKVKTKNTYGRESEIDSYPVKIKSPWYFSSAAIILYAIILVFTLFVARHIFLKRLKIHQEKLEREKEEKLKNEKLLAEKEMIRFKNEKLQSEIDHANSQLSSYTMNIIKKNELLIDLKKAIYASKKKTGTLPQDEFIDKLIQLIDSNISSDDDWKSFENHFDQAHQDFLRRLKSEYPDLTPSDLKLCAYLRMNLSSKEIMPLLNISLRGVEVRRYRLRKRLKLKTEDNLIGFLMAY
jgi:DNA-binding CsgD family transcriptional regulator